MKKEKKRKKGRRLPSALFICSALFGGFLGFWLGLHQDEMEGFLGSSAPSSLLLLLLLLAALFLQTILHEAGHLVFGLLSGYKFVSFRVMNFIWVRQEGKIKLRRYSLAGTAGQCLMAPPDLGNEDFPVALYNLGGALMNLLASLVCLALHLMLPRQPILTLFLLSMIAMGLLLALTNGVPMETKLIRNDGSNLRALLRSREARRALWVQLNANALTTTQDIPLKDMPEEWFALPADEDMEDSLVATIAVFAASRLMEERRFREADALMARLLEMDSGIIGLHRSMMVCDRVYLELLGENRRAVLEDMLTREQKKFMQAMKANPSVLRTQYAHALLAEQDQKKADKLRSAFEQLEKVYPFPCDIRSERELMELAEKRAQCPAQE